MVKTLNEMKIKNKKLIVVLGMHRSGTSAITRALQVMHVGLGSNLMPPAEGNNPTGFWEDVEINALNIEMLRAIDGDWHHLSPIRECHVTALLKAGFLNRAVQLLRVKMGADPIFGFKDPRTTKLLPFWKVVFSRCKLAVCYVLAIRHPLSVVKSLAKRDGFAPEKTYLLWLTHVIESLVGTNECSRVLVEYDRLIRIPESEISRLAGALGLEIDSVELTRYKSEFLDASLRHTVFELDDLNKDAACPPLVREIYAELIEVAADNLLLDAKVFQRNLTRWFGEFTRKEGILNFADQLVTQNTNLAQIISHRENQISALKEKLTFLADPRRAPNGHADLYIGSHVKTPIFDEENKVSQVFELSGEYEIVEFDLPKRNESFSRLRFDPANCPCVLELRSIELSTFSGEVFWSAGTNANCFGHLNDQLILVLNGEYLAWILCFGSDPNFEFVFPQSVLDHLSINGGRLRLTLRGRKVGDVAMFEWNDFRVMLRNEIDQSQWAAQLVDSLSGKLDARSEDWKQLIEWRGDFEGRELHLLERISGVAAQTEFLQASLLDEHAKATAEIVKLEAQLSSANLRNADDVALLLAAQSSVIDLQVALAERERECNEQVQSNQQACLALAEALTAHVEAYRQEALRLATDTASREQDLAAQLLAAHTSVAELQSKLAMREHEFHEQLQANQQEVLRLANSNASREHELAAQLVAAQAMASDLERRFATREYELSQQLQSSQLEALRLARIMSTREQIFASQLLEAQKGASALQGTHMAHVRELSEQLHSGQRAHLALTQSLVDQLQASKQQAQRLAEDSASREAELATQLLAAQEVATELRANFAAREDEFNEQLQTSKQASLASIQALTERVQAGQEDAVRLVKDMASREQELAERMLAAQIHLGELHLAMTTCKQEVEAEIDCLKQESIQIIQTLHDTKAKLATKSAALAAVEASVLWRFMLSLRRILGV